jgi:hypothetical protein
MHLPFIRLRFNHVRACATIQSFDGHILGAPSILENIAIDAFLQFVHLCEPFLRDLKEFGCRSEMRKVANAWINKHQPENFCVRHVRLITQLQTICIKALLIDRNAHLILNQGFQVENSGCRMHQAIASHVATSPLNLDVYRCCDRLALTADGTHVIELAIKDEGNPSET